MRELSIWDERPGSMMLQSRTKETPQRVTQVARFSFWFNFSYTFTMSRSRESMGSTGSIVERELFGRAEVAPGSRYNYLKFPRALEDVRNHQPGDPEDPKTDFAYEVFITIENLKPETQGKLRFYTAVNSALDQFYGVDGWFEVDRKRVTVDLTANPNKKEYKADIIFLVPGDGLDRTVNEEEFLRHTRELAKKVAEMM